jgi:Zn-dependent protease with chaperone function
VTEFSSTAGAETGYAPLETPIQIEPWPSERPLLVLTALVAAVMWVLLTVSVIGLVYVLFLALFFGLMHVIFVAHVRGSAVRLGPNQFPELHATVERLARRMDLSPVPEAYLMQAGGSLNAFATRFLRSHIVVLYSDLLEACGASTAARNMIIAHELGHVKAGHLKWRWFLLPGGVIPFLTSALSQAREFTCDRYGLAGAGDKGGAGLGLAILAAGATHGPLVNRAEVVRQQAAIARSGWMTVGRWLSSHPPLALRLAQVDPTLVPEIQLSRAGATRALVFGLGVTAVTLFFVFGSVSRFAQKIKGIADSTRVASVGQAGAPGDNEDTTTYTPPADAAQRARADIMRLVEFIELERQRSTLPWNGTELYQRLELEYPKGKLPTDPYDDSRYGYDQRGDAYQLWSSGPDGKSWTDDDIRYDSRLRKMVVARAPVRLPK